MQVTEKFNNGMSIIQLEERFEMLAAAQDRSRTVRVEGHVHIKE